MTAPALASITGTITSFIADHAVVAVLALMALDALLPVGGELVMLYAGVLAAGAVAGHEVGFLGTTIAPGLVTYLVLSAAGTIGYLLGALAGWAIGSAGGRPFIERHGRWLHVGPERFARAEAWFERWGRASVLLGRITPLVRSFVSIPAGVLGFPLRTYIPLTLLGSAIWCFGLAGAGWAIAGSWENVHNAFRYVDYAVVALVVVALVVTLLRQRRTRSGRGQAHPAEQRAD